MKKYLLTASMLALAACQGPPPPPGVKIGKPYSVEGRMYYPAYDPTYDETGLASWYGPGFHGGSTANGEKFDTHDLTAAHPTLPMPSIVRVTNLENGKTALVRINDRGPFARGRIIDLSKSSAKKLGVTGLSKVRVQYLKRESDDYIAAVKDGRRIDMFALNNDVETQKNASIMAATAPSDQTFIIESTDSQTHPGDTVVSAAPVISVSDNDLPPSGEAKPKSRGGILISDAQAAEPKGGPVTLSTDEVTVENTSAKPVKPLAANGALIQVGSFSQQANALKAQASIAPISAQVTKVEVGGHEWWRVQAGPFGDDNEAQEALNTIRQNIPDARIIK